VDPASNASEERRRNYVDLLLYVSAAATYVSLAVYNKWLLDWIVGPLWLVGWVWGLPALVRLIRRQPVFPKNGAPRR
jgi:hypothetical protein